VDLSLYVNSRKTSSSARSFFNSLVVPLASVLQSYTGSWHAVFVVSAITNVVVVFAALFILKPMREAHHSENARIDAVVSSA